MALPIIAYRRDYLFDVTPKELWSTLEDTDRYQAWWPWLREFSSEGDPLVTGSVMRGTVVPPLPYRMRIEVELVRCVRPKEVDALVHGDLEGSASLRLSAAGKRARAEVSWSVEMMQRPMRLASRVAHPVLKRGHDFVVELTVGGFRRHLADERRQRRSPGER